jgi:hypothetical protein
MLHDLLKKLHIYLGLLSFTILLIFGIIGLYGLLLPPPDQRIRPEFGSRTEDYRPPPNRTDKEVAEHVLHSVPIPLAPPPPPNGIRRNDGNDLMFQAFSPNGLYRVTVLEKEGKVRIEHRPSLNWQYLNALHTLTIRNRSTDWRMRLWSWYNELSIWALILMSLTGVYLWLASRPRYRWAQISFVSGTGCFVVLWFLSR